MYKTPTCCKRPSIATMDHMKHDLDTLEPTQMVNRYCLKCGMHFYGPEGEVKQITQKEWDLRMKEAFKD